MDVVLKTTAAAVLRDADNFRGFKVVAPAGSDLAALAAANPQLVTGLQGEDHLWLLVAAVAALGPEGEWRQGYDRMIAFAASKGWLRHEDREVAAHVEWQ